MIKKAIKNRKIIDTLIEKLENIEHTDLIIQRLKRIRPNSPNALKEIAQILIMVSRLYPKNTGLKVADAFEEVFKKYNEED